MSEYHKIETLYERDPKTFKLLPELVLKNPVYVLIKDWLWTEKIDGTNIRVTYTPDDDEIFPARVGFGGRTDNAQIHADLYRYLQETFTVDKMRATFPDAETSVVLYGEGYGAGIQKGGGDYSATKKFVLFDVFVPSHGDGNRVDGWWLSKEGVDEIGAKLGIDVVPYLGKMTLEEATQFVREGFDSELAVRSTGIERPAEGLVGRPAHTLYDKRGKRLIVKLKTKDFPS